jgi:hypothetical protein
LQASLPKLFANSQRAVSRAGTVGDKAFKVTGFGQQSLFRQAVEGSFDQFRRGAALTQFTRQLDSTMLATCEQVHCGTPYGDGRIKL